MKTIYNIILSLIINCVVNAQAPSQMTSNVLKANEKLILNGREYTSIPSNGGQVFLEDFPGSDFGQQLQNAIDLLPDSIGIINCRGVNGTQTMDDSVSIDKPVRILLGKMTLTMDNSGNKNMFNIRSSGVDIIGMGRSANSSDTDGKTKLIMSNDAGNGLMGYHIYNRGFNSITIRDLDLRGKQSTIGRQYGSANYPLNGAGGIYMERDDPDTRILVGDDNHNGNGNILGINIENVYIEGTKGHGIYFDTPVLCSITNVRVSGAGGHGIFIWGGTSCNINSVYVSSANYAGFCLWTLTYATVMNSVAEYCGVGFWLRSSKSISLFNTGVEQTYNLGDPYLSAVEVKGLKLQTTTKEGVPFLIEDIKYFDEFIGHCYLITGGEGLSLFSPYGTDPGNEKKYKTEDGDLKNYTAEVTSKTRYIQIMGGNSGTFICNPSFSYKMTEGKSHYTNDIQISTDVSGLKLEWDPNLTTVDRTSESVYVAPDASYKAPIRNKSTSTMITSGNRVYTAPNNKY